MVWIVGNGAPKTGSTWVVSLISSLPHVSPVPEVFRNPGWSWPSVVDCEARAAAAQLSWGSEVYYSKQHWRDATWLLDVPGVKVVNSFRDIRDVIVSRYHHDIRVKEVPDMPMSDYLRLHGRSRVAEFCTYHERWVSADAATRANYHVVSYEHLSADDVGAAICLARFCGLKLTRDQAEAIVAKHRFGNMKVTGPGAFYRKGKVGAFSDGLTEAQAGMILDWANTLDLPAIKGRIAARQPLLGSYLAQTDQGVSIRSRSGSSML